MTKDHLSHSPKRASKEFSTDLHGDTVYSRITLQEYKDQFLPLNVSHLPIKTVSRNWKGFVRTASSALTTLVALLAVVAVVRAGTLAPTASPAATSFTLTDLYVRLTTNATTTAGNHIFAPTSSVAASMQDLTSVYNAIPTIDGTKVVSGTSYLGITGVYNVTNLATSAVATGTAFGANSGLRGTLFGDTTASNVCNTATYAGSLSPSSSTIATGTTICGTAGTFLGSMFNGSITGFTGGSQANGGADDYNNGGNVLSDTYLTSWTTCNGSNGYCGYNVSTTIDTVDSFQDGVSPTASYASTTDNVMQSDLSTTNQGTLTNTNSGVNNTIRTIRTLLKFDISTIPTNATIASSTVIMTCIGGFSAANTSTLHTLLRSFSEAGSTWNQAATGTNWTTAGASSTVSDRSASPVTDSKSVTASCSNTAITFSFLTTSTVTDWVGTPANNLGLLLISNEEQSSTARTWASRENSTASIRPKMGVHYTYAVSSSAPAVKDNITNLIWSYPCNGSGCTSFSSSSPVTYTWDSSGANNGGKTAAQLCASGNHGLSGWSLPHRRQLLQAYVNGSYGTIEATGTTRGYWSAAASSVSTSTSWDVNLSTGAIGDDTKTTTYYVRCVR